MDTQDAIRHMLAGSGLSGYEASRQMGRSPSYISATLGRRSDPTASVLAEIAGACGYSLELVGHGERLRLGTSEGEGQGAEE